MERMWRKVNQGLISKPTASGKIRGHQQSVAAMLAAQETAALAAAASATAASQSSGAGAVVSFASDHHRSTQQRGGAAAGQHQHPGTMASGDGMHRSSRRSHHAGGGDGTGSEQFALHVRHPANANSATSTESRRKRRRKSKTRCNKNNSLRMNTSSSQVELIATKETSLRERAVAKFKMLNFNINWNMHITNCRPCRSNNNSNIITRRLCRNRGRIDDNELYRSNSFKFERFKRKDLAGESTGTLPRPVSVCDDYSLPVDFVKKIGPGLGSVQSLHLQNNHNVPSPLAAEVICTEPVAIDYDRRSLKVLAGYSHPKDVQVEVVEECESNDQLRSSDSSLPESSDDEAIEEHIPSDRNSPESLADEAATKLNTLNPSPYYYADILAKNQQTTAGASVPAEPIYAVRYKQPNTIDQRPQKKKVYAQKRYSVVEEGVHIIKCETPSTSSTSDDSNCTECRKRRESNQQHHQLVQQQQQQHHSNNLLFQQQSLRSTSVDYVNEIHHFHPAGHPMPPHRLLDPTLCACSGSGTSNGGAADNDFQEIFRPRSIFYVHDDNENGCADCCLSHSDSGTTTGGAGTGATSKSRHSMRKGRGFYETAFDSKVGRSDDDLDDIDRINSHEILNENISVKHKPKSKHSNRLKSSQSTDSHDFDNARRLQNRQSSASAASKGSDSGSAQHAAALAHDFEQMQINAILNNSNEKISSSSTTNLPKSNSRFQNANLPPSPPSTAPLPLKFPHHHESLFAVVPNNNQSAPDLPHHRRNVPSSIPSMLQPTAAHQQHSRLRQIQRQHHPSADAIGSTATMLSDSSSITGGTHHPMPIRPLRPHKERPHSMIVGDANKKTAVSALKNKRCQLRQHLRLKTNFSSTESMTTSSSGGSMESLRSSNSEGNRSTTSYESRHSTSLSSHSSDSGSRALYPLRTAALIHSKLHILSPISDKSSLEHNAELLDAPGGSASVMGADVGASASIKIASKRLLVPNRTHLMLAGADEIQGSDSGISLHSRDGTKSKSAFQPFSSSARGGEKSAATTSGLSLPDDIASLPFDMPKLMRRRQLLLEQKQQCTSDSATSVDLGDLPFDMPKLKRRLRQTGGTLGAGAAGIGGLAFPANPTLAHLIPASGAAHTSTESSGLSHASSSQSIRDDKVSGMFRQNLTLHFNPEPTTAPCLQLDMSRTISKGLHLNLAGGPSVVDMIDVDIPLERQSWYHGAMTRIEAENVLRPLAEGCFLVRNCESSRNDYSLSLKSAKGFMHMRIQQNDVGRYILGQFSQPFGSISEIIRHYCLNRLPVRGAEHMCLLEPVAAQLL